MALTKVIGSGVGQVSSINIGGSGSANTFNDYEEGTFTPAYTFATPGNSSNTLGSAVGHYTKVGNAVTIQLDIRFSAFSKGNASGAPIITGLPFASKNTSGFAESQLSITLYQHTFTTQPVAAVVSNSTTIRLERLASNAVTAVLDDADANAMIWIAGTYIAA